MKEVLGVLEYLELGKGGLNSLTKAVRDGDSDFTVEGNDKEYRFIKASAIWLIYKEAIKERTLDGIECHLDPDSSIDDVIPYFLAIDWEETAQNCYVAGYGETFSGYDDSEEEFTIGGVDYYAFRAN